jgi:hypothetical protein
MENFLTPRKLSGPKQKKWGGAECVITGRWPGARSRAQFTPPLKRAARRVESHIQSENSERDSRAHSQVNTTTTKMKFSLLALFLVVAVVCVHSAPTFPRFDIFPNWPRISWKLLPFFERLIFKEESRWRGCRSRS